MMRSRFVAIPRQHGPAFALALIAFLVAGASKAAVPVPIDPGTIEMQVGVAGIVLPENFRGTFSAQPEARIGYFISRGLELQAQGDVRVWPLGGKAPDHYGIGVSALYFPALREEQNFYLLGGLGGALIDPPGPPEGGVKPFARAGVGFKVSMAGLKFLGSGFLNMEYRFEKVFVDAAELFDDPTREGGSSLVSGAALGLSFFR
jgi:hypothetical protein